MTKNGIAGQHSSTRLSIVLLFCVIAAGCSNTRSAGWKPVRTIDFSAKHDVMIRNDDGTLTPMDTPYFKSTLIAPGTWQILSDGDYAYLIEGDREALAIDSTYGAGNIRAYMQSLTRKPLRYAANTHEHFDHTANDGYFDRAYMSAETAKNATHAFPSFDGVNFPKNYPIQVIGDGYHFELGNRDIEVFEIPNHTLGDLAFLDRRQRLLFSGDVFMPHVSINPASSVTSFAATLRKLKTHRNEFDRMAGGPGIVNASYLDELLENAEYILEGHEGDPVKPMQPWGDGGSAQPSSPVIYDRQRVRPPDRPAGMGAPNDNLRSMNYAGCTLTYDIRHVRS